MPDSPTDAKFLSDDDKLIAIERLRDNQMGVLSREWRWPHVYEALKDLKTWFWVMMIFCASVSSNGIGTFGPLIIQSIVSDPFQTMLWNVPVGLAHALTVSLSAFVAMKIRRKGWVIASLTLPPIAGLSVLSWVDRTAENKSVLLVGFFLLSTFTGITPLIYSWSAQNTAGDTKRKTVSALVFVGSSAGNICGPLLFRPKTFTFGLLVNIFMFSSVLIFTMVISGCLTSLNLAHERRRVALGKNAKVVDTSLDSAEEMECRRQRGQEEEVNPAIERARDKDFSDATDLENEDFVFVL